MARIPQSGKKTFRVSEVITDHGTSLGILLQRANLLIRVEQLLSGFLDPEIAAHFQVAAIRENRLILISPSASWATQLRMQAPQLVNRLSQAGFPEIEHIDIRVAPLAEQHADHKIKRALSPAARQALEAMARIETDSEE
jgi:hypothetical protein